MPTSELPESANIAELAELFGVSPRQARNLLDAANVKSVQRGRWPLAPAVRAVLAKASEAKDSGDLGKARARAAGARADGIEMANAEKRRELVSADDCNAVIDHTVAACVEMWNALPAMITRDMDERRRIEGIVRSAQMVVVRRLGEARKLLCEGGELPDAELGF